VTRVLGAHCHCEKIIKGLQMNRTPLAAIVALVGLAATPAQAQTWTGFYLGVEGGYTSTVNELDITSGPLLPPNLFSLNFDGIGADGGVFGIHGGFDYQIAPQIVLGLTGDYVWDDSDTSISLAVPPLGVTATGGIDSDNRFNIGGRAGYLTSPDTLIYGSAGYTRLETSDLDFNVAAPGTAIGFSIGVPSFSGYYLGGGIETKLRPNISLSLDYKYQMYDAETLDLPELAPGLDLDDFATATLEPDSHTVTARVTYRLDGWTHYSEPLK
jgi:outer membrane immunogenic protein